MPIEKVIGFQIWMIDFLSNMNNFFIALVSILSFIFFMILIVKENDEKLEKQMNKYFKLIKIWIIVGIIILIIIPSKPSMYLMLSSSLIQEVSDNRIPEKALKALSLKLDEYLKEVEKK